MPQQLATTLHLAPMAGSQARTYDTPSA